MYSSGEMKPFDYNNISFNNYSNNESESSSPKESSSETSDSGSTDTESDAKKKKSNVDIEKAAKTLDSQQKSVLKIIQRYRCLTCVIGSIALILTLGTLGFTLYNYFWVRPNFEKKI